MGTCWYCKGDLAERAVKCQHCGEWTDRRAARIARGDLHPAVVVVAVVLMVLIVVWVLFGVIFR